MRLKLEQISGEHDSAVVTAWHVKEKQRVEKGQDMLEVSTDKATFDVSSPCSGVLDRILVKEGETAGPEDVIAEISEA